MGKVLVMETKSASTEPQGKVETLKPRKYAVFYSSEVNGIWSDWAFESIVPFSLLHKYVASDKVQYTVMPLTDKPPAPAMCYYLPR